MLREFENSIKIEKNKKFWLAINSGIIESLLQNFLSATDHSSIDRSTIIGMLISRKIKKDARAYMFLFLALIVHIVIALFGVVKLDFVLVGALLAFISLLAVNQKMTEYRIKNGYYGGTPYEVREIISFIEEHSDKDDFSDGDRVKKIFQEIEKDDAREVIVYGEGNQ